jgi:hypothetical protein
VARIYRGLKETLVPMARESVLAHLLKLEHEGRARRVGDAARPEEDAWHIIDP